MRPHVDIKMSALMQIARMLLLGLALNGATASAKDNDPCLQKPTVDDVQFTLSLKDSRTVYQEGEIIPLVLSFTSSAKSRYWADVRNYDRSGRLGIEYYCLSLERPIRLTLISRSVRSLGEVSAARTSSIPSLSPRTPN